MAFTDSEIADYTQILEKHFWSKRRPPLELRDKIREGQRFTDQTIDLFFVRPHWRRPEETVDSPIARIRYVRSRRMWQLYWIRGDGKWHRYVPYPHAITLEEALRVIELGTGTIAPRLREYRDFSEARFWIRKLGLRSESDWRKYCSGKMPSAKSLPRDIPKAPRHVYRNRGWVSWSDWLGTDRKRKAKRRR